MKVFPCLLLLVYVNTIYAQDSSRILIKADQQVSEVLTPEKIYQYPKFTRGKVYLAHERPGEALFNYNYLNGEIEFIGKKNDTLIIAPLQRPTIQQIIINTDTFYYNDGYMQQVLQTSMGKFAKRRMLVIARIDQLGAFDRPSNTTRSESLPVFKDYFGSTMVTNIRSRENIMMLYKNEFFFSDKYNSFLPANKKNLLKLFPSKKELINDYLKVNKVNFSDSDDLKKLFLAIQ